MIQTLKATYTGTALVPDEPVLLPVNAKVRVILEMEGEREPLPVEMLWVPNRAGLAPCEDCDEYLWARRDAPTQ